ncbi:HlyD family efflux transporter periplasmic adaptor subunit [Luteibacter flocculans]|uniref:HlyD family efflux transporter periplasmic adaptor subunit n=1 Tax=Luteibacter flocculans TaxID=2780091 RepID=A0ABY4SZ42_9GAMM|nr:HlyD family efflux transporter periplasmic adaptor subunit [Luteibacter flocculans]URL57576.1 HlyD family efflux transporter periplasmic adaptor subunit [Luteibacter flocculans]
MAANLYRQEAIVNLKSLDFGVPMSPPKVQRIAARLAVGVTIALVVWLCIGSYTRRVAVKGVLEPRNGVIHLRAPMPGKVVKIHVSPGTKVKAGATLLTLAADQTTERHGDEVAAKLNRLLDDRRRLRIEASSVERSFKEQERTLTDELHTARSRSARMATQRDLQVRKIAIKQDLLDRMSPLLAKGYVSSLQYKERESERLQAESELESISAQYEDARQAEASLASRLKRLSDELTEKLGLVNDRLSNVEQAILQTETQRSLLVNAPTDGEVTNIFIAEGSGASPSETLITFIPSESDLVARVLVDSRAIGFIKRGTPVAIRYQPFPYEKFGLHHGHVSRVPGSAIEANAISASRDLGSTGAAYRVDVDLPHQTVSVYGKEEPLMTGMEVTADLLLDRRTLIEWMFEPLIAMNKRMDSQASTP